MRAVVLLAVCIGATDAFVQNNGLTYSSVVSASQFFATGIAPAMMAAKALPQKRAGVKAIKRVVKKPVKKVANKAPVKPVTKKPVAKKPVKPVTKNTVAKKTVPKKPVAVAKKPVASFTGQKTATAQDAKTKAYMAQRKATIKKQNAEVAAARKANAKRVGQATSRPLFNTQKGYGLAAFKFNNPFISAAEQKRRKKSDKYY